jgi:nucleoid-associated protein YgaU
MPVRLSQGVARPLAAVALAAASLVAAAAVGSIFLSTARDARTALAAAGPASPADGILVMVALVGVVLSLWVGLGMALSALSALPGALGQACTRLAARMAPAAVRKVVAFVLGTALTAALVPGTAVAGSAHQTPRQAVVASAQYAVGVLANVADAAPDASFRLISETTRPSTETVHTANETIHSGDGEDGAPGPSWSPDRRALSTTSAGGSADVVVHRGDSLWSIAARHLGPTASTPEISAEWHRWFAANQHVIGDDANLITPGQVLSPPASGRSAS